MDAMDFDAGLTCRILARSRNDGMTIEWPDDVTAVSYGKKREGTCETSRELRTSSALHVG